MSREIKEIQNTPSSEIYKESAEVTPSNFFSELLICCISDQNKGHEFFHACPYTLLERKTFF